MSLSILLHYRNAEVTPRECSSHKIMEAETKIIPRAWRLHLGESVLSLILFSSNPCATNRAFNILLLRPTYMKHCLDHDLQPS